MAANLYIDTRGKAGDAVPFTRAVVNGLAEGGGLYVPQTIPHLDLAEITALADMPYAQRAALVYKAFNIDLLESRIDDLMAQAYGGNFDDRDICPIVSLDENTHMLELWHGPTSAFKDMALQCLPLFFSESARHLRDNGTIDNEFLILVATSGDTGKAALEGFAGKQGVRIAVLYPDGGVSDIQRKQMATQAGDNVMVWAVRGNFDDCQTGAKNVFGDETFGFTLMDDDKVALSSANSINWGRLLPQVVYYVSSYSMLVKQGKVQAGSPIDVCVPTGNFGNILAAWYAKQMGTPIERLLCASNENRVLTDFINTGTYDIGDREFVLTPSPSMDILVSSNLERQLFELTGRNAEAISGWMHDLKTERSFRVDEETFAKLRTDFTSESVDNEDCLAAIKDVFEKHRYLIDPHTAVAYEAAERMRGENPVLIASTAHWAKFGDNVYRALHDIEAGADLPACVNNLTGCQLNDLIAEETGLPFIPEGLSALDSKPIRFDTVIDAGVEDIESAIISFLNSSNSL
jgi:threonine synthase